MAETVRFVRTSADSGGDGTTNTDSSGDSTHAYDSLANAEAGEDGLTHTGNTLVFKCSVGSGSAADTTAIFFIDAGWTSPPSKITVITDDGYSAVYDTAKYRMEGVASYTGFIRTSTSFDFTIGGIQTSITSGGQAKNFYAAVASGNTFTLVNCIGKATGGTVSSGVFITVSGSIVHIINNLFYDQSREGIRQNDNFSTGDLIFYNNTINNCVTGIHSPSQGGDTSRVFNNLLTNNGTADYSMSSSPTTDNNVTSDASGPDSAHINKTVTYADAGGKDFQTSDTDVVGLGTDLSADSDFPFSTDRLGVSRGSSFDIGCFQDVAVGFIPYPNPRYAMRAGMQGNTGGMQ